MELKFYGNREPIELIRRMVCKNREQRSILIHGEKGLGKKHLAKYIAAAYLCREHDGVPCGECKSCRMIMHGTHPDIINVKANANGNYIIDESIRPIVSDSAVMPNESRYKVYIIPDLDRSVNTLTAVQNILLKLIEEPPEHVVVILTARSKEIFLPTIISRTLPLAVSSVSEGESQDYLKSEYPQLALKDILLAVAAGRGNIGRCKAYIEDEEFANCVSAARELCDAVISADEYKILKALFAVDGKKQAAKQTLELFGEIGADACLYHVGTTSPTAYVSCYEQGAQQLGSILSASGGAELYDTVLDCIGRIDANCNLSLTLNSFAVKLSDIVK